MRINMWQEQLEKWRKRREEIYNKYLAGKSMNKLGREYGVSAVRIKGIVDSFKV